jgi:hypothetical protein
LSQLLGMIHHLPLGLRISQQLARPGIHPQGPDATEHALPGNVNTTGTDQ